ncbi:MAG: hypothetical protein QOG63_2380 [Thermoleophilaceae bacterium]|nr:hypothetical protein [Thermoleophilaceae bacterium]
MARVPGPRTNRRLRRRAIELLDDELERIRVLGYAGVSEMAQHSPLDALRDELTVTARVQEEAGKLMVLVEVWSGRRVFATGGFAMFADGSTYTPD